MRSLPSPGELNCEILATGSNNMQSPLVKCQTPRLVQPYLRARLARGCFHMLVYALRTHRSTPKRSLYAWLTALLHPETYYVLHCAGPWGGQYVALLRQFALAQTALYCIAHAQTGQHCRNDANDIPDLQGQPTFFWFWSSIHQK